MMCTILQDSEKNIPTSNEDLNEALERVRKCTGEDWQLIERKITKKKWWFSKPRVQYSYALHVFVGGIFPYQTINFYRNLERDRKDFALTMGGYVSAETIMAYLYGTINGVNVQKSKSTPPEAHVKEGTTNEHC